jgi:hypothetical protein
MSDRRKREQRAVWTHLATGEQVHDARVGIVAGALVLAAVTLGRRLFGRRPAGA